ncbi:hypothetical protein Tco_1488965 [Tanacetum coccineum]
MSIRPSHKRSRSPTTSILLSSPIPGALSYVRADLLPPRKRIRSPEIVMGLKDCSDEGFKPFIPRETSSRADIEVGDALRAEGIDDRVVVETVAREEVETSARGIVVVSDDRVTHPMVPDNILEPAHKEGAVEVIESIQRDQGHMIVASSQQGTMMSERISKLERDNTRLRGTTIPNTRSGATMTREAVNKLIARRVAEALEASDTARNLKPLVEGRGEQEDKNGDDYKGGNGGGNGNRGVNVNEGNRNGGVNGNGNGGGNGNGNDNGNGNGNG